MDFHVLLNVIFVQPVKKANACHGMGVEIYGTFQNAEGLKASVIEVQNEIMFMAKSGFI
jgi:hypothetical protein